MSAIETPDYQRAAVRPQQQIATVAGGTATVTVTLPANCDTLAVHTPGGAPAGTLSVTGQTSGIKYPGRAVATDAAISATPAWFFTVSNVVDASVAVTFANAPAASWYVVAGPATTSLPIAGGAGGATPGATIVRKFPFAWNTPNISAPIRTGASMYTPTVGDIIHDAWIEVDTNWNGTTPRADIGQPLVAQGDAQGWFENVTYSGALTGTGYITMTRLDAPFFSGGPVQGTISGASGNGGTLLSLIQAEQLMLNYFDNASVTDANAAAVEFAPITAIGRQNRYFPAKFVTADPIKIWVTQTGRWNGADPVNTTGTGVLYLVTSTPM